MKERKERYYDPKTKRLLYTFKESTPEFWDAEWDINEDIRRKLLCLRETFHVQMVKRYLKPHDGLILEGGCGNGGQVAALVNSGYRCIGVDLARKAVEALNTYMPELDVRLGDVRNLAFEDDYFAGYISKGVIEHFWDGYESIIEEMERVIKPGGYLFLAFPYMSPIRKIKGKLGLYELYKGHKPDNFYQFALDHNDVIRDLRKAGFRVVNKVAYNPNHGLWEEFAVLGSIIYPEKVSLLLRALRKAMVLPLSLLVCHCMFLILQKREINS